MHAVRYVPPPEHEFMPIISIIMPCFNAAPYIGRTIESVQAQTLTDWEMIVVDDGSTDDSYAVAHGYALADPRIRVIRQSNLYTSRARNNGYERSSPESAYLLFLDADDLLPSQAVSTMTSHLDRHPNVGAAYGLFRCIDATDRPLAAMTEVQPGSIRFEPVLFGCLGARRVPPGQMRCSIASLKAMHQAIPSCTYFRRLMFERAGKWDTSFSDERVASEDQDMVLRTALIGQVHFVNETVCLYRRHSTNLSSHGPMAGHRYLDQLWRMKTFAAKHEREAVRRAMTFDAYLSATLTLRHAGALLKEGALKHGVREIFSGLWKTRKIIRNYLDFSSTQ